VWRVFLFLGLVVVAVLVYAAFRPGVVRIQRAVVMDASAEKIFGLIDDFHCWREWAPQDKGDAGMVRTFSGAASGVGAVSEWDGAGSTGKGRMTITESEPSRRIKVEVDFEKPFAVHNVNEFVLAPVGGRTRVTWTMLGPNVYMMKLMGVFVNMDRVMGRHFEMGLENLKKVAEG
jgi:uncharacterized protein YndB with AHSA1/START domain